ncbi:hypothetical protein GCM10009530_70730 [Microbispora corallina]|uniref:Uncharacterized protein n=1 Tax=Microbispora corallina TaxID=83302 RepID=A0ABQ4GAS0_9ACTN|nr:hypothetical protein [Microbispora corallina]GIH44058.1 hypothetical protein Mco01_70580 [Microbispora corallina]
MTSHDYRVLLTADIENYGSRGDAQQRTLQSGLITAVDTAADRAGLDRQSWLRQVGGDSLTAVLPAEPGPLVTIPLLLDQFLTGLDLAIALHNSRRADPTWSRMRVRLAVHVGPLFLDGEAGWPGQHAVQPARLRDSAPIRAALDTFRDADLALIISQDVFRDYVSQGPGRPRPSEFLEVAVAEKKQAYQAYLYVPHFDVRDLELAAPSLSPSGNDAASPQPSSTIGSIKNRVKGGDVHIAQRDMNVTYDSKRRGK